MPMPAVRTMIYYSTWRLAALMIGHHFAISAF
jgi:hypothetical protein